MVRTFILSQMRLVLQLIPGYEVGDRRTVCVTGSRILSNVHCCYFVWFPLVIVAKQTWSWHHSDMSLPILVKRHLQHLICFACQVVSWEGNRLVKVKWVLRWNKSEIVKGFGTWKWVTAWELTGIYNIIVLLSIWYQKVQNQNHLVHLREVRANQCYSKKQALISLAKTADPQHKRSPH